MSYGKFFTSCFSGSMVGAGANVFALWGYVIAHAIDGQVEVNPRLVALTIGMTLDDLTKSLAFLCAPDPESRNKDEEGRRLVKEGQFAYRVVSHAIYRAMRDEDDRREYNRIKKGEQREREKLGLTKRKYVKSSANSNMSAQAEAEAEAEAEENTSPVHMPSVVRAHEQGLFDRLPDQEEPPGLARHAPADLSAELRPIWTEIAKDHGPLVATKARDACKRIHGAVTPARMRETFAAAYQAKVVASPIEDWPDFRTQIKNDKAGLTGADKNGLSPEDRAAYQRKMKNAIHIK